MSDKTIVQYNGITLHNVLTRSFSQEAVYDDSHTDLLYQKFTIRVVAYVHGLSNSTTVRTEPISPNASAVPTHILIRHKLMEPRGDFRFTVGGLDLLIDDSPSDRNNGPKPLRCDITHLAGSGVFRVEFEIEICKLECAYDQNSAGVLSNRWSVDDEINADWYIRRTVRGRLRLARADLNPQAFRGWVVPPLLNGFRRESMTFTSTPDGLNLDYIIADQQIHASSPSPATTWEATHTESTGDGVTCFGEINVTLHGPAGADKKVLIQLAAQIMEAKLGVAKDNFESKKYMLEQAAIVDHLHENSIEFRARVKRAEGSDFFGIIGEELGKPLALQNYNPHKSPVPASAAMASPAGLFACYLQSPCNDQHRIQQATATANTGIDGDRTETAITYYTGDLPSTHSTQYTYEHRTNLYTHYRIFSKYVVNQNKLQLPIAAGSSNLSDGPSAVFVRLAPATAKRIIDLEADRVGDWPGVIAFQDYEDGALGRAHLLKHSLDTEPPQITADGITRMYVVKAHYEFGLERAPAPGQMKSLALPWQLVATGPSGSDLVFPANAERYLS